jgi:hypothetical protein
MRKLRIVMVLMLTVGLLTACGGGGGGGVTPDTVITQDNAADISHRILDSAFLGEGSLENIAGLLEITDHDCVDGGNVITIGIISTPPAVADKITTTYNNCNEYGIIMNGETTNTIAQVSDNFDGTVPFTLHVDVEFTNLSSEDVDLGLVSIIDGAMSVLLSETLDEISSTILGNSLTQQWDGEVETLSDFLIEVVDNSTTGDYSLDLNGTIDSTLIGGSVSYDTTTLFTGNVDVGTGEPTAGVLHVTTSSSQALLTALPNGINVEIKVDADGDDVYESTILTTWAEL